MNLIVASCIWLCDYPESDTSAARNRRSGGLKAGRESRSARTVFRRSGDRIRSRICAPAEANPSAARRFGGEFLIVELPHARRCWRGPDAPFLHFGRPKSPFGSTRNLPAGSMILVRVIGAVAVNGSGPAFALPRYGVAGQQIGGETAGGERGWGLWVDGKIKGPPPRLR